MNFHVHLNNCVHHCNTASVTSLLMTKQIIHLMIYSTSRNDRATVNTDNSLSMLYQSRISRAERLFNYDVIDSHAVGCNSNKQNDPIDDALRGHHALASLPAGI